jgi:hypothetical protein
MKKTLLLLAVIAVMVLLFAPVATAQYYGGGGGGSTATATAMSTASPTASATASAMATATSTATATTSATASVLPKSGGPPLVGTLTLLASLALISSGVGALLCEPSYLEGVHLEVAATSTTHPRAPRSITAPILAAHPARALTGYPGICTIRD